MLINVGNDHYLHVTDKETEANLVQQLFQSHTATEWQSRVSNPVWIWSPGS